MGILKYVIGRTLNDSGSCDFLQNDLGSHERWFDSEEDAEDFISENIDDDEHEYFVMESEHSEGYEKYWKSRDVDYRRQVKKRGFWTKCNRQVLFHKFRQIIFHNPRHLRFHSPRHFIFHTCHYAVSSKNDFLFSSL